MASIDFAGVSKRFPNGTLAVDDMDLTVADGEFMIFVGPSGCGKTTALRMVAGLEEVTSGEIRIGDRVVNDVEPPDRDIAMVFQNYALYPHMSVEDNMSFPLRMQRLSRGRRWARVRDVADAARDRRAPGAQAARALGRPAPARGDGAGDHPPPAGVPDGRAALEPRREAAGPDAGGARELHRRLGVTTIYVTHDQTEAMTLGQRVVVLNKGLVQQVDTPQGLYQQPANTFVASFIGSPPMNFIRGRLDDGVVRSGRTGSSFPGEVRAALVGRARQVTCSSGCARRSSRDARGSPARTASPCCRPRSRSPSSSARRRMPTSASPGSTSSRSASGRSSSRGALSARLDPRTRPSPGRASASPSTSRGLHLFDPESGRSVLAR